MNPVAQTKFGVLAIGSVAATLILWLSISFWLDAWRQREDARLLARVAVLEDALLDVAREVARERADTVALLGMPLGATRRADEAPSPASLAALRERIDRRLDTTLLAVASTIDEPALAGRLRHSTIALRASLDALDRTRRTLAAQRADSAVSGSAAASSVAREHAMRRGFSLTSALIERLQVLQGGLYVEPHTTIPSINDLRRLKADLRDYTESVARAAVMSEALWSSRSVSSAEAWELATAASLTRARAALERLALHERDQTTDLALLTELGELIDAHTESGSAAQRTEAATERSAALDASIGRAIAEEVAVVEAHAHRRLVIDTLLIAVCFWIAFASLRLLRNVQHQAWHDRLTGLPNRFRFEHLLSGALAAARQHEETLAVAVLDIDDFKSINDTLGHETGDALLSRIAERLAAGLPPSATLAALGGDEFAILFPELASADAAQASVERLRDLCRPPFIANEASLRTTLSVGIALSETDDPSPSELLRRANVAMRQAKDAGRDRVRPFDRAIAERNRDRLRLEKDLRYALERGQLELHYQPKVGTRSARVDGLEALIRWRHPDRGLVPPGLFVPIAERCGLIRAIGAWVLDEAVRQSARWRGDGLRTLQIAVNVSAEQLVEAGFATSVERVLARYALPSHHLELEVTESVGMADMKSVVECLGRLRAMGVRIAIDDFGTDYSSLQYLETLPLDTLKIDRAFVARLGGRKGRSLAHAIVSMAGALELSTVAEGVETHEQLEQVHALGCDHVQGYYYSPPIPAADVPGTITRIESELDGGLRAAA